jgi:hypothetical protein
MNNGIRLLAAGYLSLVPVLISIAERYQPNAIHHRSVVMFLGTPAYTTSHPPCVSKNLQKQTTL